MRLFDILKVYCNYFSILPWQDSKGYLHPLFTVLDTTPVKTSTSI